MQGAPPVAPPQMYAADGSVSPADDWMSCYAGSAMDDAGSASSGGSSTADEMRMWDVGGGMGMDGGHGYQHGTPDSVSSGVSDDSDGSGGVWQPVGQIDWHSSGSTGESDGGMSDSPSVGDGFQPYPDGAGFAAARAAPAVTRGEKRPRPIAPPRSDSPATVATATAIAAPAKPLSGGGGGGGGSLVKGSLGGVGGIRSVGGAGGSAPLLQTALEWVKETNVQGHILRKAMPAEFAELLLREPSFCPGARPAIFAAERGQWIFKESIESENKNGEARRTMSRDASAPASDRWHNSGGAKNSLDLPAQNPQVRRRYGAVEPRHVPGKGFVYHEYVLLNHGAAQPGEKVPDDRRVILYHVMPKRASSGARKAQRQQAPAGPAAAPAAAPAVQHVPPQPRLPPQPQMPPLQHDTGAQAKRSRQSEPGSELLPPARPAIDMLQASTSATEMEMEMVEMNHDTEAIRSGAPIMTLRAPAGTESATFIHFEKSNQLLGALKEDGRGLKLSSAGGDIAEWHRKADKPGKPGVSDALGEGDLVGIISGELTRITQDAHMLGVITRKAMVAGSQPEDEERDQYDTVAYVGRVPVKVRGPAKSGDRIGPSGRNDGTGVVVTHGQAFVGTVLRAYDGDSKEGWRFVEISVAAPGIAAGSRVRSCSRAYYILLVAAAVFCVCLSVLLRSGQSTHSTQQPALAPALPPVDCSLETFMKVRPICDATYRDVVSPSDCDPDCTRLATGLLENCDLNVTNWPMFHGDGDLQGYTDDDQAYNMRLVPIMMVQARGADPQISPLSSGICYLGAGSACYVVFNVSSLHEHDVVSLMLNAAKYAATGMDAPFGGLTEVRNREPERYTHEGDDITVNLASSDWARDNGVKPTYSRLLAQADDVGLVGRLKLDLPLNTFDLKSTDLFAVRLSSTSATERPYAGIGLPDRWATVEEPALWAIVDPVHPDKYVEYQDIIQNSFFVNSYMTAMCVAGDSLTPGGFSPLNEILDGPSSCPGVYRGMSHALLVSVKQTQCPQLGEGVSWPACCAGGPHDSCTFAPGEGDASMSAEDLCAACPVGSKSDPSAFECYSMPEHPDECTVALAEMNAQCGSMLSDDIQVRSHTLRCLLWRGWLAVAVRAFGDLTVSLSCCPDAELACWYPWSVCACFCGYSASAPRTKIRGVSRRWLELHG